MAGRVWSREELDALKKLFGNVPLHELAKVLPDRTLESIRTRAYKLGLHERPGRVDMAYLKKLTSLIEE